MALITDATQSWSSPIVLSSDEIWQARSGNVFVTTTSTPDANDGFALIEGRGVLIRAGLTVRYRKVGPTDAVIVHEFV